MNKIIASGLIIIKDNKLLLANDGKDPFYKFPGGKPLKNESLEDCAIRELKEETGLNGIVEKQLPTMTLHKKPQTGETIDIYLNHFKGEIKNKNYSKEPYEHNGHKIIWADLNEIKSEKIEVAPNVLYILKKL